MPLKLEHCPFPALRPGAGHSLAGCFQPAAAIGGGPASGWCWCWCWHAAPPRAGSSVLLASPGGHWRAADSSTLAVRVPQRGRKTKWFRNGSQMVLTRAPRVLDASNGAVVLTISRSAYARGLGVSRRASHACARWGAHPNRTSSGGKVELPTRARGGARQFVAHWVPKPVELPTRARGAAREFGAQWAPKPVELPTRARGAAVACPPSRRCHAAARPLRSRWRGTWKRKTAPLRKSKPRGRPNESAGNHSRLTEPGDD